MGQWAWYAVQKGSQPGVYRTWKDCETQVRGFGGARFKGFNTREEAEAFVHGGTGMHRGSTSAVMRVAAPEVRVSSSAPARTVNRVSGTTAAATAPPSSASRPGSSAPVRSIIGLSSQVLSSLLRLDPPSTPASTINGLSSVTPAVSLQPSSSTPPRTINGLSAAVSSQGTSLDHSPSTPAKSTPKVSTAAAAAAAGEAHARSSIPGPSPSPRFGGQGHFSQFEGRGFKPDNSSPFSQEFERLSSSQGWKPGSQEYNRQRASALRNELRAHYFPSSAPALVPVKEEEQEEDLQPLAAIKEEEEEDIWPVDAIKKEESEEEEKQREAVDELQGFRNMCREVGKEPAGTLEECKAALRETLVNIVDLIDVYRTGQKVEVWDDFVEFMEYTLHEPGKTIPAREARLDPILECFLKNFRRYQYETRKRARSSSNQQLYSDWLPGRESKRIRRDLAGF